MEHPDQAPAFTLTVRTPQCGHTVWGNMLHSKTKNCGLIGVPDPYQVTLRDCHKIHMGLSKNPDINQMVFPRVMGFFSSYRFSKCWLHTLMKQFILCVLCGISPYNHQLHTCFSGKSLHLQSLLLRTCPINNI